MANILSAAEAANFVRASTGDAVMLQLLPLVDTYLLNATGHNWAADASVSNTAKLAAGMLLIHWYDNPGLIGQAPAALSAGLVQLEAEGLSYRKYAFDGASGAGSISLPGARKGDVVQSLTGVYGVSGDQKAAFEATLSEDEQIQQTSTSDLSDNCYVVVVKHPADDVSA
jgi:hypothetical protein